MPLRLRSQVFQAEINDNHASAEVRTWQGKWVGEARVAPLAVGDHETRPQATRALAAVLRKLADDIESDAAD